ncbi:MAG: serine/threonine protein kinase, partial [Planctomycetales bacterium]|nr:serine/threonine protein kinase [Planctomycetales bacterium]
MKQRHDRDDEPAALPADEPFDETQLTSRRDSWLENGDESLEADDWECVQLIHRVRQRAQGDTASADANCDSAESESRRLGRFEIVRELGRGGSGIVFLAFDPDLKRHVALKTPRPEYLFTEELKNRFVREAQAAASLKHESIVSVYEAGQVGAVCYIAAEYCSGDSLADWLRKNTLPLERVAAAWVCQLADGVAHAHAHGVLHRDLKPANVLLVTAQQSSKELFGNQAGDDPLALKPKLTDFGLAKLMHSEATATRTGALLGTPAYMAP